MPWWILQLALIVSTMSYRT